jgi:hypothetical protein
MTAILNHGMLDIVKSSEGLPVTRRGHDIVLIDAHRLPRNVEKPGFGLKPGFSMKRSSC